MLAWCAHLAPNSKSVSLANGMVLRTDHVQIVLYSSLLNTDGIDCVHGESGEPLLVPSNSAC